MGRALAWGVWALVIALWVWIAPEQREDVWGFVVAMMRFDTAVADPWVITHFQLMGVWPMLWLAQLDADLRARPLPAWPFAVGSMFLGAFILYPWFGLRPSRQQTRAPVVWLRHPAWPLLWGAVAVGLVLWAAVSGSPAAWEATRQSDGFLWVMTLDTFMLLGGSVGVAWWRRHTSRLPWWVTAVPWVGTAAWLAARER